MSDKPNLLVISDIDVECEGTLRESYSSWHASNYLQLGQILISVVCPFKMTNSLSTCSTLWDNYAYFLGNFKVSGHTSKPFKCKSTGTYIIPGENRTIGSSFRATTGQGVGSTLRTSFLTRVLACLLIYFLSLEPF